MDVRMPDGTVINNVPDNITQTELLARYNKFKAPPVPQNKGTLGDLGTAIKQGVARIPEGLAGLADIPVVVALLTTFGVRELGDRRYSTLSSGEKKRVMIARALMADPELLLLDEPAAGLDVGGREDLLHRFAQFSNDPSSPASVLVTHHIEEIPMGTTHAILLKDGKIAVSGPVDSVITTEHVSAVFGLPIQVTHESSRFFARA